MLRTPLLMVTASLLMFPISAWAGPVLLGSIPVEAGLGSDEPIVDQRIEFTIQIEPATGTLGPGVGVGMFWEDGAHGVVQFTAENDPGFAELASLATNGVDDLVIVMGTLADGGGAGGGNSESVWLGLPLHGEGGPPDLAGYDLDFVQLAINRVDFDRYELEPGIFIDVEFGIAYEFYGHPVPEPSTILMFAAGWGCIGVRRRFKPQGRMS